MSLDVFDSAIRDADIEVARNAAPGLPSTFAENFDVALRHSSEWENSNAYEFARERALAIYYDDIKARTGVQLPLYGMGGAVTLDELNQAQTKVAADFPALELAPLTEQSVDAMALRRMAKAHGDAAAIAARERTWGGTFGNLSGGLVGALGDPLQIALLPLGGAGEAGVALRALEFASIAAGTQAGAAALSYRQREAAVPGSSREIPGEIIGAGLFGGALGGAVGLLGKFLSAGARKPPTSIAEDVNAGASDAQFNAANVFRGAVGEAANRDAVMDSVNSILRGDRVKAGDNFDVAHVSDFAESVGAKDRAAVLDAAEAVQRPITRDVAPEVEQFDRIPSAIDDAADYWDQRLAAASPEERAALGAVDDVRAPDLAPEQVAKLAADPVTDDAVLRNLDRLRLESPDLEFSMNVVQPDGSVQLVTRRLEDVIDEIDGFERAGKELLGCVTGLQAAE